MEVWMYLFLDLLYVCMMSKLSDLIVVCQPSPELICIIFSILYIFYSSRFLIDEFCARFAQDDVFHRLFYFIYTVGILVMVMNSEMLRFGSGHSEEAFQESCHFDIDLFAGFGYGFIITRGSILTLYMVTMKHDVSGLVFSQFFHRILHLLVDVSLFVLTIFSTSNAVVKAICIILVAGLQIALTIISLIISNLKRFGYLDTRFFAYHFPMNHLFVQSRLGQWLLLAFGEAIISLLRSSSEHTGTDYVTTVFGLLLIYMLAMYFYDQVQKYEGVS